MQLADEFRAIDLGDRRLNRRAVLLAEQLGQRPSVSIPNACTSWTETAAAYRASCATSRPAGIQCLPPLAGQPDAHGPAQSGAVHSRQGRSSCPIRAMCALATASRTCWS